MAEETRESDVAATPHWRSAALAWVMPVAIVLIAVELQRHWGDAASPVHIASLIVLGVAWVGALWERQWAQRLGPTWFDAAILIQLIGGLYLIHGRGDPAGGALLDELLFWAPSLCAWWALCYLGHLRHTIILALVLYLGFFIGGLLDGDHAFHEFVLQGALLIGLVTLVAGRIVRPERGDAGRNFDVAMHDTLTHVVRRPYFEAELAHTAAMSDRYQQPFTLVVATIADYADYCRNFGAEEGSRLVRAIAWVIAERIRRSDTVCRWQDEAFVVLLPYTRRAEAEGLVETLRGALAPTKIGAKSDIALNFGVAEHEPGDDALTTLDIAEQARVAAATIAPAAAAVTP